MAGVATQTGQRAPRDEDGTVPLGGRLPAWRPGPYTLIAAVFFAVMNVLAWRNNIISDFGQHASAIDRIAGLEHRRASLNAFTSRGSVYGSGRQGGRTVIFTVLGCLPASLRIRPASSSCWKWLRTVRGVRPICVATEEV